ncbi:MAG: glycosyltransferase family 2 protein [Pseudomonadota bacterium]
MHHPSLSSTSQGIPAITPDMVIVAIPALNEEAAIADCLRSLIVGDPFMKDVQIVVADGGSTDRTLDIIEALRGDFPNVTVLKNPARLQSAGINAVVEQRAGPTHQFLVRCDAHAHYPRGYVRKVVESLALRSNAASVAVPMDSVGYGSFSKAGAWIVDTKLGSGGSAHRGGTGSGWVDHGHHAGFRLDWFRKVGGYDSSFSHNEDAEYDHRIGLAGGRVWLDADIRLEYHMRSTLTALAKQYWTYGKGRARTVLKHKMKPRLRQMIPVAHVALLAVTGVLGFAWPVMWLYPALYVAVLIAVAATGAKRLGWPSGLWAGPALGAMHIAWGAGFLHQCLAPKSQG